MSTVLPMKPIEIIRFLRRPFDHVCHIRYDEQGTEINDLWAKLGDLCAWFASGTDCRCCIGMRIPFAFIIGLGVGLCL